MLQGEVLSSEELELGRKRRNREEKS